MESSSDCDMDGRKNMRKSKEVATEGIRVENTQWAIRESKRGRAKEGMPMGIRKELMIEEEGEEKAEEGRIVG